MNRFCYWAFAIPALLAAGCSTLRVKVQPDRAVSAERVSREAAVQDRGESLAAGLAKAARLALSQRNEKEYNAAVAGLVAIAKEHGFRPGETAIAIDRKGDGLIDPALADQLIPASAVEITGLPSRSVQSGMGVPYVAYFKQDSPFLTGQPGIPKAGIAIPVTAMVDFQKGRPELKFIDTLERDEVLLGGRRELLAADFSAPIAILLLHGRNRSIDVRSMFLSKQNFANTNLAQFQPFDPGKRPVVFVHGLISRPEAWTLALNTLLADREIRKRYQFWFFGYPTGLPVWASASVLRSDLDNFRKTFDPSRRNKNLDELTIVGHSMGGLITSLMIRDGGERLWNQFSEVPLEQVPVSGEFRSRFLKMVNFKARDDVSRVIFVSTPHRGSRLALLPIAQVFSDLIQLPFAPNREQISKIRQTLRKEYQHAFTKPMTSIVFLEANSPLLNAILALPNRKQVPYHSIIGDRGRGDSPNSSDGVVPYWSSHLKGAVSEKVVPSGHGAIEVPQGALEIRRILKEY